MASEKRQRQHMASFRMTGDEHDAIKAAADREELSVSEFIRETALRAAGAPAPVTLFGIKFASETDRDAALLELQHSLDRITEAENRAWSQIHGRH